MCKNHNDRTYSSNNIMKLTYILSLLAAAFIFAGCASTKKESSEAATSPATSTESSEASSSMNTRKTSYDGSTGPGLLMERYKTGNIEGYRN